MVLSGGFGRQSTGFDGPCLPRFATPFSIRTLHPSSPKLQTQTQTQSKNQFAVRSRARKKMKMNTSASSKRRLSPGRGFGGVLREQRAKLYIIRRCVVMLLCWHD